MRYEMQLLQGKTSATVLVILFTIGLVMSSGITTQPETILGYIVSVPAESALEKKLRYSEINDCRSEILVIVHRGAYDFAPENTLEAFGAAMDRGADGCEIDIRRSTDGILYLHHDDSLGRVFRGNSAVNTLTYSELLKCQLTKIFGTADSLSRMPTFAALLTLARQRNMLLHLDIKEPRLEDDIAALLDSSDTWNHIVHINDYNSGKLRKSPQLKLLTYKGWAKEAGETDSLQKAFLAKPDQMVFTGGNPDRALKLIGREVSISSTSIPNNLRIPFTR